jgi:hypothetical protein
VIASPATPVQDRIADLDWDDLLGRLDDDGFVLTPPVYTPAECAELAADFDEDRFRSTVDMRRYRFGEGLYRYYSNPLPPAIDDARHALYPALARLANRWAEQLRSERRYPAQLDAFLQECHDAGQTRPTPLILRYGPGGHNTLHQDVYGDLAFPIQAVTVLDRPGVEFEGGQFVLLEQRPRAQSRAHVIELQQGAFLLFPTRERPVLGTRGHYRTAMRHGVATVHGGQRTTLGNNFHDAP